MWQPFNSWIREEHARDVGSMYADGAIITPRFDAESLRLWEKRVDEWWPASAEELDQHADAPPLLEGVRRLPVPSRSAQGHRAAAGRAGGPLVVELWPVGLATAPRVVLVAGSSPRVICARPALGTQM
jgi:hypothetical protein